MSLKFEWNTKKAKRNIANHGISFDEAATAFSDSLSITFDDPDHSEEEKRFITIGMTSSGNLIMVSHTDRNDRIRIISARKLTRKERKQYEKGFI